LGGHRTPAWRSRRRALAVALAAGALATSIASCGGGNEASDSDEAAGSYDVKVVTAEFPTEQQLGQTSLLRLGVRNTGERTIPALTVTITVGGEEGRASSLPFAIRDPQPGLAQPDRPVWVLAARYPRLAGSSKPAGVETAASKTYDFGPLKPGRTTEAIWKLVAVKAGQFTVLYDVGGGLGGAARAETAGGTEAGGSFAVHIDERAPDLEVTDSGEVVEIQPEAKGGTR
jgi:hypothetical protein